VRNPPPECGVLEKFDQAGRQAGEYELVNREDKFQRQRFQQQFRHGGRVDQKQAPVPTKGGAV
jgi:hypothetical protein